jgi:Protein of unknown function (DUF3892)
MPPCLIGMEACVGAHHLSRKLRALGQHPRLKPAKYVRPYSKGQKAGASTETARRFHCWLESSNVTGSLSTEEAIMADWQITCVNRISQKYPYDRILGVGGGAPLQTGWRKTPRQVINMIRTGEKFWVSVGGKRVEAVIAALHGREYIKTEADDTRQSNLLSLPPCR